MQKFILFIIVLLVLGGGYYFYAQKNKQALAPTTENGALMEGQKTSPSTTSSTIPSLPPPTPSPVPGEGSKPSKGTFSSGEEGAGMAPDILVVQVDYDGVKFSPSSVDIKVGDIVIFKNNSSGEMWPASAPHPSHTAYPEFDAKEAIDPGGKWQFKFEKAGNWKYHNHLNPSAFGAVNVTAK